MDLAAVGLRVAGSGFATGDPTPPLSWRIAGNVRDVRQLGYQIQISEHGDFDHPSYDTGEVSSDACLHIAWPGTPLASRQVVYWRVRSQTNHGWTPWSERCRVEAALLESNDWVARFIGTEETDIGDPEAGPAPMLRKTFRLDGPPAIARLYITALGLFDVEINGRRVGGDVLAPDWTAYRHRVPYYTYDVADLLVEGDNAIGAVVGNGWYRGRLGFAHPVPRCLYGKHRALLAQLEVIAGNKRVVVATDGSWTTHRSEITCDDLYNGTDTDLRHRVRGWSTASYAGPERPATELSGDGFPAVFATNAPPVRATQTIEVANRWLTPDGKTMVDVGQNLVGWLRMRISRGRPGDVVTVRHAEVLDADGNLFTTALRAARATDTYTLDGADDGEYRAPRFTFHGFRYAEIDAPATVEIGEIEAVVVHSDMQRTGSFECSDLLVDRLFENIVWGQRGNFVSIPTDCPQRSERMGWTGDIQVFTPTGAFIFDCEDLLGRWLTDLMADQNEDGSVPNVVPNPFRQPFKGCGGWGDAVTVVPWALYEAYGDADVLRRSYPSMKAWVDFCATKIDETGVRARSAEAYLMTEGNIMEHGIEFGDWCDPSAGGSALDASTDRYFMASAYLARSAGLVSLTAEKVGLPDDAVVYAQLAERVRAGTWAKWADHLVTTQTGCATALAFGIAPTEEHDRVAKSLATLVEEQGFKIGTGFLGTPLVLRVLTEHGYAGHAHAMLAQRECPSWMHQVLQGATTIWERWDAIGPDGKIRTGGDAPNDISEMLSFNHYAFGAVAEWLVRDVAGLSPDISEPGYRHVRIAPHPGGGISWARASCASAYGPVMVHWRDRSDGFLLEVSLPPNTSGTVTLPARPHTQVTIDGEPTDGPTLRLASGAYTIIQR